MFKPKRVGVLLGSDCNFNCKYCFRPNEKLKLPAQLSDRLKKYLSSVSSEWCESVVCTGGETLLYFDLIKEVFSYVPKNQHKVILTNGSLLTQEIVNYVNENDIEVHLSHDGEQTKFLRGVDVLENPKILNLVKQIKVLMVFSVITSYNPSIKENYEYVKDKLQRDDFIYLCAPMIDHESTRWLIKNFDYDMFYRETWYFLQHIYKKTPYYHTIDNVATFEGGVIDLDGNVRDLYSLEPIGTIDDSANRILMKFSDKGFYNYCKNNNCLMKGFCRKAKQIASEHICKCVRIRGDFFNAQNSV